MHYYVLTEHTGGKDEQETRRNFERSLDAFIGRGEDTVPAEERHPVIQVPSWWRSGNSVEDVEMLALQMRQRGR